MKYNNAQALVKAVKSLIRDRDIRRNLSKQVEFMQPLEPVDFLPLPINDDVEDRRFYRNLFKVLSRMD